MLTKRPSIRQASGSSVKSSIFHNWTRDTRDDPIMATKGEYVKLSHELAGIGGDASFYKAQSETVISRKIASNTVRNSFHISFCRGFLTSIPVVLVFFDTDRSAVELAPSLLLLRSVPVGRIHERADVPK